MDFLVACALVFVATLVANLPLIRLPLTEDEGNHYYLAQFYDRGARMHTSYSALGYFEVSWLSCLAARLCGCHTPRFYQCFKGVLYAAGSASTCLLACILTGSTLTGTLSGLLFAAVTATRSTKFWATYGEHAQVTPMTIGLACAFLVVQGHAAAWSLLAGVCMGVCIHLKPTGLLFAGATAVYLLLAPSPLSGVGLYLLALAAMLGLPFLLLRTQRSMWPEYGYRSAWDQYVKFTLTFTIRTGLRQICDLLRKTPPRATSGYSDTLLARAHNNRFKLLQIALFPALWDLWIVPFWASLQLAWGAIPLNSATALMAFYLLCMLLTQHIQQNYYTPHFNIIWPPLCILAAMFMHSVLQGGMDTPGSWLLCGLAAIFLGQRIHEAWTLRNDHVPWNRYLEAACIGKALHPLVQRTDVLLAMGIFPSINIYADCPGIPTHLFGCMDGEICHKDILVRRLREYPPQWITFYTPTAPCPWDIRHIMEVGGQVYTPHPVSILPEDAAELARYKSGLRQFMAYRLNDRLCAINQCELGREALARGETSRARELFTAAASVLPEEMALRLKLLELTPNAPDTADATDAAIEYLHTARGQSPVTATFLLVETFVQRGALPLARKYLSDLTAQEIQSYADDPRLHVLRAQSRADMAAEAGNRLEILAHALKLHPFHVPTLRAAITVLDAAGQLQGAAVLLQSLLQLRPNDAQAIQWNASLHPRKEAHD